MEDKSLFNSNQPQTISEGLQNFIDAMVEEIVIEGKPFDTQKKYLKKFSENEGLDYDKLEADITTFIEILDSLKTAFSKLQVKLAEEKGRECHVSEKTLEKLVGHSSRQDSKPKTVMEYKEESTTDKKAKKKWPWLVVAFAAVAVVLIVIIKNNAGENKTDTFPNQMVLFVDELNSKVSTSSTVDWDRVSLRFDSLQIEYGLRYNSLSINDLDRIDEAIDRYYSLIPKKEDMHSKEDLSKIVVDDIEYRYEEPTVNQIHEWRDKYRSVCATKIRNMDCHNYSIPASMKDDHPCLVYLVMISRSLSSKEQKENWFNLYPMMEEEKIDKLYVILYRENYKIGKIENEYELKKQEIRIKAEGDKLNHEAYDYAKEGDYFHAMITINKAIELNPGNPNYYDSKGEICLMQGRTLRALAMWNKVIKLDPDFLKGFNGHTNLYDGLVEKGMIAPQ